MTPDADPKSWPFHEADELDAAQTVLRSGRVTYWAGNEGRRLEQAFADYLDVPHTLITGNGTLALELMLAAHKIGPGDEVLVPCRTYIATAGAVARLGATPVVCDVDPKTFTLCPTSAEAMLSPQTKAILTVPIAGNPCHMDALQELAQTHGLLFFEDAAQAHGARYDGTRCGAFGDGAAFSFCGDKIISSAGEGGLVVLKDKIAAQQAAALRDHGKDLINHRGEPGLFSMPHTQVGSNFRMPEVQAAVARVQLGKLSGWLDQRAQNAAIYSQHFSSIPDVHPQTLLPKARHAYYRYDLLLAPRHDRNEIVRALRAQGIAANDGGCCEIHREGALKHIARYPKEVPVGARLAKSLLSLPVHHRLAAEDIYAIASRVLDLLSR